MKLQLTSNQNVTTNWTYARSINRLLKWVNPSLVWFWFWGYRYFVVFVLNTNELSGSRLDGDMIRNVNITAEIKTLIVSLRHFPPVTADVFCLNSREKKLCQKVSFFPLYLLPNCLTSQDNFSNSVSNTWCDFITSLSSPVNWEVWTYRSQTRMQQSKLFVCRCDCTFRFIQI